MPNKVTITKERKGKNMFKKEETKYKNEQTKNKGITLIALVITIIVILILAGVSINTLFGDNGLLTKANDARKANEKAVAYDKIVTEVYASYGKNGEIDLDQLNKNFKNHLPTLKHGNKEEEKIKITEKDIEGLPTFVELDGYEFEIDAQGNVNATDNLVVGDGGGTEDQDNPNINGNLEIGEDDIKLSISNWIKGVANVVVTNNTSYNIEYSLIEYQLSGKESDWQPYSDVITASHWDKIKVRAEYNGKYSKEIEFEVLDTRKPVFDIIEKTDANKAQVSFEIKNKEVVKLVSENESVARECVLYWISDASHLFEEFTDFNCQAEVSLKITNDASVTVTLDLVYSRGVPESLWFPILTSEDNGDEVVHICKLQDTNVPDESVEDDWSLFFCGSPGAYRAFQGINAMFDDVLDLL